MQNRALSGHFGPWELYGNGLVKFEHPYTFNLHGSFLFCRDCWEEEVAFEFGTLEREV